MSGKTTGPSTDLSNNSNVIITTHLDQAIPHTLPDLSSVIAALSILSKLWCESADERWAMTADVPQEDGSSADLLEISNTYALTLST